MSPEQQASLIAAGDYMRANPLPWEDYPKWVTDIAVSLLMPGPNGFIPEQSAYLKLWNLQVTSEQLSGLNSKIPLKFNTIITARQGIDGNLYISADLLSDAILNRRLSFLFDDLKSLPMYYLTENDFKTDLTETELL